ncbi:TPA: uberolysin/carnocyclin family circular bacteriocin [Staphylococcus aureus]|nr:uberolysin/carnocyclin family circular bacteriocin [Staphylococcus aureus]HDH4201827.1 uberolysin/carnocyclin family circular bacteriocin [Staphylococcus aureus]HDH4500446.1 uberolysin/carnocyclin family circular bacteriocin [Staphylococcus aureus]HDH4634247.1 uberolysin/carnocyclin family circular bacteriocin [Staphylococcus aureus]HDH4636991.1 uberolysin/carnocyclin family circular bacteriocin [Staphylococcus aureus]
METLVKRRNTLIFSLLVTISIAALLFLTLTTPELTSTLGVSTFAAKRAIDIIAAAGNVAAIVGLVGAVTGAGIIGAGILFTAKKLIKHYGKGYAAAW